MVASIVFAPNAIAQQTTDCAKPEYRQTHLADCNSKHDPWARSPGGSGGGGLLGGLLGGLTGGLLSYEKNMGRNHLPSSSDLCSRRIDFNQHSTMAAIVDCLGGDYLWHIYRVGARDCLLPNEKETT